MEIRLNTMKMFFFVAEIGPLPTNNDKTFGFNLR